MKRRSVTAAHHPGLRERNKVDKLRRIQAAARELFTKLGFERATTRDIARRAGVGLGTLFNYAGDKRDLVFLIFIDELDRLADRAFTSIDRRKPLLDQLVSAFAHYYRAFGANPRLARILLQELTFYSSGKLATDFQRSRRRTVRLIESVMVQARRDGFVREDLAPGRAALSVFFLYAGAVRWWIARGSSRPAGGIAELRELLRLHIAGLAPRRAPPRKGRRPS